MKLNGEAKLFIGILVVALPLAWVALGPTMGKDPKKADPPPPPPKINREVLLKEPVRIRGDKAAPYTLVEFGDYQCPMCKTADSEIPKLLEKLNGKVNYAFRYFRAADRHQWASVLARGVESAEKQGKFWEMHKAVFDEQDRITNMKQMPEVVEALMGMAKELKLDLLKFKPDLSSEDSMKQVAVYQALGEKVGITATPTFYIVPPGNGQPTPIGNLTDLKSYLGNASNFK